MSFGSMPNDDGNLLLTDDEKQSLLATEPAASRFVRPFLGSKEFINRIPRWCLWLVDASPSDLRSMPAVTARIEAVREARLASPRATTNELARTPSLFGEIRQPTRRYLAIPKTSSERRPYIPMAFLDPNIIASTELFSIENTTLYHFGVLSSALHMAWVRQVCGRLESRYRYSNKLVYNNFPWPQSPTDKQKERVERAAQAVLDARAQFPSETLASLYDPLTMPPPLAKAHADLDTAVDRCYRPQPFPSDRHRFEFLFSLYEQLTAPLTSAAARPRRRRTRT